MLIATFGSSTGWVGKTISYDNGVFTLEGFGPITAANVMEYDRQGHLAWAYAGLKEWVDEVAGAAPTAASVSAQASTPHGAVPTHGPQPWDGRPSPQRVDAAPARKKRGLPVWAVVVLSVLTLGFFFIVYALYVMWLRIPPQAEH